MLSTNVLCIKKKKKRSYCIVNNGQGCAEKNRRSASGNMLQITEDTPPDMLAGAMDLTVHLPTGRSVKMSVERSTPMMDLLVQITTNYHLQLSGYTLQALGMAPSKEHSDSILPYKPNTPIGALDTQHIRVVPKSRTVSVPKNVPPGHQPFESTFRLKVHLPRNQLYVTRVSQGVHLGDIMKKVCEEKNLDPLKYEFRHPGNLDETLDPKLTLSDYAITEIHLVQKGIGSLNQTFSTGDIMSLRKEEERRQMHSKTGGGVFNLIFRRGKSSTGSLSSENRSISPTHSDDSRSVTPPAVQQPIIAPPEPDKPKPPQRKRRPAPKPPNQKSNEPMSLTICHSRNSSDSSGYHEASILSDNNTSLPRRPKSTMISEEQQKSLGQHSQSTSNLSRMAGQSKSTSSLAFPSRKKKSAPPPPPPVLKPEKTQPNLEEPSPVVASQPCTVAQTETHDKGQVVNHTNPKPTPRTRTKTAPSPRPRSVVSFNSEEVQVEAVNRGVAVTENEKATDAINPQVKINSKVQKNEESPVAETAILETEDRNAEIEQSESTVASSAKTEETLVPEQKDEEKNTEARRSETKVESFSEVEETLVAKEKKEELPQESLVTEYKERENNREIAETEPKMESSLASEPGVQETSATKTKEEKDNTQLESSIKLQETPKEESESISPIVEKILTTEYIIEEKNAKEEPVEKIEDHLATDAKDLQNDVNTQSKHLETPTSKSNEDLNKEMKQKVSELAQLQKQSVSEIFNTSSFSTTPEKVKPPEIVAVHPKPLKREYSSKSIFDSYTRKRGFQIGSSLLDEDKNNSEVSTPNSVASALNAFDFVDEIGELDVEMFKGSLSRNSKTKNLILNELHGMHELQTLKKNTSGSSLRSVSSFPGFLGTNMKKWSNYEDLDEISLHSDNGRNGWVIGDTSDTESVASQPPPPQVEEEKPKVVGAPPVEEPEAKNDLPELETDWQYQLPSPPKAFRDSSPVPFTQESTVDSVVTSPELFEKLKVVKDNQSETVSDITSMVSEEEKPILNKLSLENLEKRKSLVYNRELATSLKMQDEERKDTFSSSLLNFEKTYDEVKRSSPKEVITTSTLPNFKITTYNNPKQKIDIFEDDTIRSGSKRNSYVEPNFPLQKSYIGRSMENISFRKNRSDDEYKFYKPPVPKTQNVLRSESFSKEPTWTPSRPVARSKSQVALNKYRDTKNLSQIEDDNLTKSNSLFDVSGLQSLEVIKSIQNKLNTPNNSTEQLDKDPSYQKQPEIKSEVQNHPVEKPPPPVKTYQYRPPSINMSTWSERPKIPVNVKDDPDYKQNTSKLIVNTVNNDVKSHNSVTSITNGVSVRVGPESVTQKNVSIKVNGSEPVTQSSGNVVIKIGASTANNKPVFRKPLGNVNFENQRPHSIALPSDFDISRVPIVRSVEFKKPYKDFQNGSSNNNNNTNNTSVTQIYQNNNTWSRNGSTENETIKPQIEAKPVFRVNSYLQNASTPVVRGFRSSNEVNRMSWSQPNSFSTLPAKPTKNYALNAPVPFSQANLRRTESSVEKKPVQSVPPPAPIMPKSFTVPAKSRDNCGPDPKEQLLQAIRDFGGKKGLRVVKA